MEISDKGKTWDKTQTCEFDTLDIASYPYSVLQESTLWQAGNGNLPAVCRVASQFFPAFPGTVISSEKFRPLRTNGALSFT